METKQIIDQTLALIKIAKQKAIANRVIYEDKPDQDQPHEFLFFIKPEILQIEDMTRIGSILELLLRKISQFGLSIRESSHSITV
jgi:hypothetical protein